MSFLITYDGAQVANNQADPLVSKTTEYVQAGERWGTVENITLNGVITGTSFDSIYTAQNDLINVFNEDFKTLSVEGFGNFNSCRVESIDFGESDYLSTTTYNINLQSYGTGESLLFTHGVVDPVNSISYVENDNMTVGATRTISAKGVNITEKPNAVNNAIDFIQQYTGQSRKIGNIFGGHWVTAPFFVKNKVVDPNMPMLLVSQNQSINRFTAEVSLTEEYVIDATGDAQFNQDYILRYTEASAESDKSREHISLNGTIEGSKYSAFGIEGATQYYKKFKDEIDGFIYNESLTEDPINSSLSFSFEYDKGYNLDVVPDIKVSVSENSDSSLISLTVNGTISAKGAGGNTFERVKAWFNEREKDLAYDEAQLAYEDYLYLHPALGGSPSSPDGFIRGELAVNPHPLSKSVTEDKEGATISFSYTFDDRFNRIGIGFTNPDAPNMFDLDDPKRTSLNVSLSFKPMVEQITTLEGINGVEFFDMGYHSLASFGINIDILGTDLNRYFPTFDESLRNLLRKYTSPEGELPDLTLARFSDNNSVITNISQVKKAVDSTILDQKSYSLNWDFKSRKKLTNHVDNGGAGGYINDKSSFMI